MALDHGTLNIPLAKRGNIDAQIDRYKAEQAIIATADRKAKAQEANIERAEAKRLVAKVSEAQLKRLGAKSGLTISGARKKLTSMAHWQPELVIAALA